MNVSAAKCGLGQEFLCKGDLSEIRMGDCRRRDCLVDRRRCFGLYSLLTETSKNRLHKTKQAVFTPGAFLYHSAGEALVIEMHLHLFCVREPSSFAANRAIRR
jgi:hypothetical protein